MQTRYEATMDGTSLSSLDDSIVILDIRHRKPEIAKEYMGMANRPGSRITKRTVQAASVMITFMIRKYSISARQAVCDKVVAWAGGSILTTNDRDGKQLRVTCDEYPVIDSAMKWTDPVSMVFTANEWPYWEDSTQTTLTLTGSETSSTMSVPGSVDEARVEATVTANGSVSALTLVAGSTEIELTGLSLVQNDVVTIDYDAKGNLRIMKGETSILGKRTAASSDDLLAACGKTVTFAVEASAGVTAVFKVRGCWL